VPSEIDWFSDTQISLPQPPSSPPLINLGGFWFTAGGICHNITQAALEDLSQPFQSSPQAQTG
jgi:hypothetical protein